MGWHTIEPASRIREGAVLPFEVAGRSLAVGRARQGYFAIDDVCPHAGARLSEGLVDGEVVVCPIHGYAYHVFTGEGIDDGECVRSYAVELDGDVLRVHLPDPHEEDPDVR